MAESGSTTTREPCVLFTAFEPSGDEHAAPIIEELRRRTPDVPIYALGGPKMEAAGATIIERTTDNAAMLSGAFAKIASHWMLLGRLKKWMRDHPVRVHVPTDSPAANWSICKMVKRMWGRDCAEVPSGAKVVHMVAPQVWAWANWRVRKLKKWSDLVLCILPFEPAWFAQHGVNARFIGHPVFDEALDVHALDDRATVYPNRELKVAILPGSRMGEVKRNAPLLFRALREFVSAREGVCGMVAASSDAARTWMMQWLYYYARFYTPKLPLGSTLDWNSAEARQSPPLPIVVGQTEAVLRWADVVLTASGTATLHVARHGKPMVVMYRVPAWQWYTVGWWLIGTRTFTLPNLIACGGPERTRENHIVHEAVPMTTDNPDEIVREMTRLIESDDARQQQVEALLGVCERFKGHNAGVEAAEAIMEIAGLDAG